VLIRVLAAHSWNSECHPGAKCYETGVEEVKDKLQVCARQVLTDPASRTTVRARYPQVPKFDGEPVCQYYCWDTPSCCGFRNPTDCAACNSSHGCHPKAPCYNLKREL
jgi:hypothetical protein